MILKKRQYISGAKGHLWSQTQKMCFLSHELQLVTFLHDKSADDCTTKSKYLSAYVSICLSVSVSVYLDIYMSMHKSNLSLSVKLSMHPTMLIYLATSPNLIQANQFQSYISMQSCLFDISFN